MYLKKLNLGNIELDNNIILAPMAGITDRPFRIIAKEYGAGLVVTEMISSKAILYGDKKTKKMLNMRDEKRPVSVQIFGSDIEAIKFAVEYINNYADIIDINMGCPAQKIVKNGDGSSLLKNLYLAEKIIETAVNCSVVPITVKYRTGWDSKTIIATEFAKMAENTGAKMLTIHGRTKEQYYSGNVNLDIIKEVKNSVKIPVIGNGDIKTVKDAEKMFEYTNVDGIMIGRAAIGNPWFIQDVIDYLSSKDNYINKEVGKEDRIKIILKHLSLLIEEKGEKVAVKEMRKHIAYYVKNLPNATDIRARVNVIEDKETLENVLKYF